MKTIFVPVGGTANDEAVFETAYAAARLFLAHLAFFHVRIDAGEAALWTPHAGFARGAGLRSTLQRLEHDAEANATAANHRFATLCRSRGIEITDTPGRAATSAPAGGAKPETRFGTRCFTFTTRSRWPQHQATLARD